MSSENVIYVLMDSSSSDMKKLGEDGEEEKEE